MHDLKCTVCGRKYEAARSDSKTCSPGCRTKLSARSRRREAREPAGVEPFPIGLLASTVTELAKVERQNTPAGQAAILLAYRLEQSAGDTGASVAAMVKQLEATLGEALKAAEEPSLVLDLKRRRDAKRGR